jgi:UDP-N-acetylglucosamine--N-acetylmuramyl-(pentapeptide) pyrophosphoryl-undecaprenol N-acetylglucosamine transferase
MRVMISGGGTGGHTSPASAIVQELRKRDAKLYVQWVGKPGAIEERVAKSLGVTFRGVSATGWPRKPGPKQLSAAFKMGVSLLRALQYVRSFQPQVAVGVGGYVSLPTLLAAQWLGVPTFVHEQNKRLGMANRFLAKRATHVFLSYPDSVGDYPRDRATVVGNPVREGFAAPPERDAAKQALGFRADLPLVLVVGGSQGAQSINRAVAGCLKLLSPNSAQVLWMTGRDGAEEAQRAAAEAPVNAVAKTFIDDMVTACAAADLIISRAGASSTAELAAVGRASVLVPYPFATDDHQTANAQAFVEAGASVLMPDKDCTAESLAQLLQKLLADAPRRAEMEQAALSLAKPHAAEVIVDALLAQVYSGS